MFLSPSLSVHNIFYEKDFRLSSDDQLKEPTTRRLVEPHGRNPKISLDGNSLTGLVCPWVLLDTGTREGSGGQCELN